MKIYVLAFAVLMLSSCDSFNSIKDKLTSSDTTTSGSSSSGTPDTKPAEDSPKPAPEEAKPTSEETVINAEPTLIRPQLFLMMKDWTDNPNNVKIKQDVMFNWPTCSLAFTAIRRLFC